MPTWIRVRDDVTGAHYDVEKSALRDGMTPLPDYPQLSGPHARPRPTKAFVGKDGRPGLPGPRTTEADPSTAPAPPADNNEEQS